MPLDIIQIPALADNYIYLLRCAETGATAVVDPSEAAPVQAELERRGWSLDAILNTHHHHDHTGGNLALKAAYGCTVTGFGPDAARIAGIDTQVQDGDAVQVGNAQARVIFVAGHTLGHIVYYFSAEKALFCADTLFSLGCGRLFEGTAQQMYDSLQKLAALPDGTRVFCAHEYTEANGAFALTLEPKNTELRQRVTEVKALRVRGEPTVPSLLGQEKRANPFLRADSPEIRATLAMPHASAVEVFAEIRRRKDRF